MIRFFQKARKKGLSKGKNSKYLAYAAGEIMLVVVGVLIALQVNNWNQQRIDRQSEKRLLGTINAEMQQLRFQQKNGNQTYQAALDAADYLLRIINESEVQPNDQEVNEAIYALTRRWLMGRSNKTNIYDALADSGELGLLRSAHLRDLLRELKRDLELMAGYEELQTDYVDRILSPFLNKNTDRLSIANAGIERIRKDPIALGINKQFNIKESRFSPAYDSLLNKREFANYLVELSDHTYKLMAIFERLYANIEAIETMVETNQ